jgi:hypothetical protein
MQAPPGFELRAVRIGPGDERGYDEAEWRDAVVFVWQGEVELEGLAGARCTVERGDVLWLVGLPLRALCNRGCEPALLIAVSRERLA